MKLKPDGCTKNTIEKILILTFKIHPRQTNSRQKEEFSHISPTMVVFASLQNSMPF